MFSQPAPKGIFVLADGGRAMRFYWCVVGGSEAARVAKVEAKMHKKLYTEKGASAYYRERYGYKYAPASFRKGRHEGFGPKFYRIGRSIYYDEADLDAFMCEKLGVAYASTSEYEAAPKAPAKKNAVTQPTKGGWSCDLSSLPPRRD